MTDDCITVCGYEGNDRLCLLSQGVDEVGLCESLEGASIHVTNTWDVVWLFRSDDVHLLEAFSPA